MICTFVYFYQNIFFFTACIFITNKFWTTVAPLWALFFDGVNLTQDIEDKGWFRLTKHILILAVTYITKRKTF